jgi:hypothetical protein
MALPGFAGLRLAERFLKHAVGILIVCWQRMLRAAVIAALIGLIGTEAVSSLSTGEFPPPMLTHLVAAALALALAYCAALTVFIYEIFEGSIEIVHMLMGEAEAGTRAAAAIAEHEAGDVRDGLRRLVGLRAKSPPAERTTAAHARRRRSQPDLEAEGDEDEPILPPLPRVTALPVPASRLPRIAWTYEEPIPTLPPLPTSDRAPGHSPTAPATELHEPTSERLQPRATRPLGSTTRPLGRATRPLSGVSRPRETGNGGVWGRLSQALVGRVEEPSAAPDEATQPDADQAR